LLRFDGERGKREGSAWLSFVKGGGGKTGGQAKGKKSKRKMQATLPAIRKKKKKGKKKGRPGNSRSGADGERGASHEEEGEKPTHLFRP